MSHTKVLLLGHRGFVGRKLKNILTDSALKIERTCEIFCLNTDSNKERDSEFQNHTSVQVDELRHYDFDFIINCLAKRSVPQQLESENQVIESCFTLPRRIIETAANQETTIINFSTYIQNVAGIKGNALESYSKAKNLLTYFLGEGADKGSWRVVDLFLFTLYGSNDKPQRLFPQLLSAAQYGTKLPMTMGEQLISLLNASELCQIVSNLVFSVEKGKLNGAYTCWREEYISIRDLVSQFESTLGVSIDCQWGANPYRGYEMFTPWPLNYELLDQLVLSESQPLNQGILDVALDYGFRVS